MTIIDYSRLSERQLVQLTQDGDGTAFTDLVNAYRSPLYGHAVRRLHDPGAAEDALQETFLRAYRGMPNFSGEYKVGPWLHRIMENVCADEGNRRRREADKFDRVAADPHVLELYPGVEDELGLDIDDAGVNEALALLPANYQEALQLRFVDGLEYGEVAAAAGVSEANARARVSRARNAARAVLRGVAAVPVFMVGLLRRGEREAAAAIGSQPSADSLVDQAQALSGSAVAGGSVAVGAAASGTVAASSAATTSASVAAAGAVSAGAVSTGVAAGGATVGGVTVSAAATAAVATPFISKAAIGVGLVVAVAVPTAGPQIVDRVTRPAPVVASPTSESTSGNPGAENAPGIAGSAPGVSTPLLEGGGGSSTAAVGSTNEGARSNATDAKGVNSGDRSSGGVVALPNTTPAPNRTGGSGSGSTQPGSVPVPPVDANNVVAIPVERFGGSIEASGLSAIPAGPRLDVGGSVQLVVYGVATSANLSARFELPEWPVSPGVGSVEDEIEGDVDPKASSGEGEVSTAPDGSPDNVAPMVGEATPKRMSANITLTVVGGEIVTLRLAGHAVPLAGAPWGAVSFNGQFSSNSSEAVALATSGNFTGSWNPATGELKLNLNR